MKGLRLLLVAGALSACTRDSATYTIASASPWNEAYGLMARQGTELAVDAINKRGGIRSHRLTLVRCRRRRHGREGRRGRAGARRRRQRARGGRPRELERDGGRRARLRRPARRRLAERELAGAHRAVAVDVSRHPERLGQRHELARFATSLGHTRAAILYENNSYGRGLADSFRRAFRGEIVVARAGRRRRQGGRAIPRVPQASRARAHLRRRQRWLRARDSSRGAAAGHQERLPRRRRLGRHHERHRRVGRRVRRRAVQRRGSAAARCRSSCGHSARSSVAIPTASRRSRTTRRWSIAQAIERGGPDRERRFATISRQCSDAQRLSRASPGQIAFQPTGDVVGKPMAMTRVRRGALVLQSGGGQ